MSISPVLKGSRLSLMIIYVWAVYVIKNLTDLTLLGAGKSSQPANSSECQIPSAAAVASSLARKLKDGSLAATFTGVPRAFSKVFGIGHSLGSSTLNYAAIVDGKTSPFVGLILTGMCGIEYPILYNDGFSGSIHDLAFISGAITNLSVPAQGVNPIRWGHLDPGYVTSPSMGTRAVFYGPTGSFDPTLLQLDFLTEDVGSRWISAQIKNIYSSTNFTGPITAVIGQLDQTHCLNNNNTPCVQAALQTSEKPFFPNADFKAVSMPQLLLHCIDNCPRSLLMVKDTILTMVSRQSMCSH